MVVDERNTHAFCGIPVVPVCFLRLSTPCKYIVIMHISRASDIGGQNDELGSTPCP